jgi:hypothetical protein
MKDRNSIWFVDPHRIWTVIAPVTLALAFWWFQARYGFNPTDDGFILGEAWRVAHGEIPHRDFTSPRPAGSALIHLPEVLLPAGMLAISRLIVVFQFLWISITTVQLITRRRKISSMQEFQLIGIAFLLNVGTWPIMAWHTVDGLFLSTTAL